VTTDRAAEPGAALSGPVTTGRMIEPTSTVSVDLAAHGFITEEFFASGTASALEATGALEPDGRWSVRPGTTAPYCTRIVVRRPSEPDQFNGTVVVEWFNVSGGVEADPDWAYLSPQIVGDGYAYVGVSAQAFGVDGGEALLGVPGVAPSTGLVGSQPARYGTLHHPGDRYSFDMFSQIGRALRATDHPSVLGTLRPERVVGIGESPSAFFLTTYIDTVQPMGSVYDGFLVHSRGGSGASLDGMPIGSGDVPRGLQIRSDTQVPVLIFETETDLGPRLDFGPARQPDTDRVRTWEVAGTAHADAYLVGDFAAALGCDFTVNEGPQHFVVQAALEALDRWIAHGTPPPTAPPLRLSETDPPMIARDNLGNALGGVRTPAVDVPIAALSGEASPGASPLCSLFGSTVHFDATTLVDLYGAKEGYVAAYTRSLDAAINRGFLRTSDRGELLAQAEGFHFPS
jgi:Alpha/beta hydrolase domain